VVRRSPTTYNYEFSRWRLNDIKGEVFTWLKLTTIQGLWAVMRRLKVHYKASCNYIHSPDLDYETKWETIEATISQCVDDSKEDSKRENEERMIVLCLDELTYYNQPSLADTYALCGKEQTKAQRALGATKTARIVGAINMQSGTVFFEQKSKITVPNFIAFLKLLVALNPNTHIYILIDNWPIHYHPNVIAALEEQKLAHWFRIPPSWQNIKVDKKYKGLNLPIQFLPLPTYASWLNPIEKLWRWLKQEVIHVHPYAEEWLTLKDKVLLFLNHVNEQPVKVLNYVGLNNPNTKYGKILFNNDG
jgi:transposase